MATDNTENTQPTHPLIPLLTIEDCEASQLVGSQTAHLSSGTLTLYAASDSNSPDPNAITLTVGPRAAFHLSPHTSTFYTHADDARVYLISLPLGEELGSGSFVQVMLPVGINVVGSEEERKRDAFEGFLLERGYLKDGVEAVGDELGRGIGEGARETSEVIKKRTAQHISSTDSTATTGGEGHFSPETHSFLESTASATQAASNYTSQAVSALAGVSVSLGSKLANLVHPQPTQPPTKPSAEIRPEDDAAWAVVDGEDLQKEEFTSGVDTPSLWAQTKDAGASIGKGISQGASEITDASTNAAHDTIEHSYGSEVAGVADKSGQVVKNVGAMGVDLMTGTSALVHGGAVAYGAATADGEKPKEDEEKPKEDGERPKEEEKDVGQKKPDLRKEDSMDEVTL